MLAVKCYAMLTLISCHAMSLPSKNITALTKTMRKDMKGQERRIKNHYNTVLSVTRGYNKSFRIPVLIA